MRFPNAAKGVKKIFTAEVLALIAAIAALFAGVFLVVAAATASANTDSGDVAALGAFGLMSILGIGAAVLVIIGAIMKIVGISQAAADEDSFKTAIICLIIGIAGSVLSGIFTNSSTVYSIGNLISQLMSLFVTIFIISGIIKLADKLNDGVVSAKGTNLLKLITVIYALVLIANLIVLILGGVPTAESFTDGVSAVEITAAVIYLVAGVLNVVQYFMYLSYLSKAKKMLAEN